MTAPRPTLSLAEAVRRSDRSRSTLQRALAAGDIEGAHREDPDDPASPWVIPAEGLLAAGYRLDAPETPAPTAPTPEAPDRLAELERENAELRHRAEIAEAVAAERADALADARLALRALTAGPPAPPPNAEPLPTDLDLPPPQSAETPAPLTHETPPEALSGQRRSWFRRR